MGNRKKYKREEVIVIGVSSETIQRFGAGVKEHLVSYSGTDHERKIIKLSKSLKSISKSKVNPEFKSQNLKQQAGFSAEVKETANFNAERAINGSGNRRVRTDDLGSHNHPIFDHVDVDHTGKILPGSGSQMKFVGSNSDQLLNKLLSKKFQKYLDADAKITVPSELYEETLKNIRNELPELNKQLESVKNKGNLEDIQKLEGRISSLKKLQKNLRKSTLSTKEANFARKHPKLSTLKDSGKIAHRAGIESAKNAALVGGGVSVVRNTVALVKGEIEAKEATKNVGMDTLKTAGYGYGTGAAGTLIKGTMQNAKSVSLRGMSKTSIPGAVVTIALTTSKTMHKYYKGDMNGAECLETIGEDGVGLLSSAMFATIGQIAIPIPVVGALVGSMVGYTISSASYRTLTDALKEEAYEKEHRILVEQECQEHIKMIREYREEMEKIIEQYMITHLDVFRSAFSELKSSLQIGDVDGFIQDINMITTQLGGETQFQSMSELDDLMKSDVPFKL